MLERIGHNGEMSEVKAAFEKWRSMRLGRVRRIPDALWAAAVGLTETVSVSRVARELRLNATELRKRVNAVKSKAEDQAGRSFVEIPMMRAGLPNCALAGIETTVQIERRDGSRLLLGPFSLQEHQMMALVREFLEG